MRRFCLYVVLSSVMLALILASCDDSERAERSLGTGDMADQEFTDFVTIESDSGITKWRLESPVARVYNIRNLLVTDQPVIRFYDENGTVSSILTSDKAEYNKVSHDLTALGNVVVTSAEGYILETESLVWIDRLEQIHTEDFVKVTKGKDILTGYGFQGYPELRNIDIKRDVKAYLKDEDGVVENEVVRERDGKADAGD